MNNVIGNSTIRKVFLLAFLLPLMLSSSPVQAAQKTENVGEVSQPNPAIVGAQKSTRPPSKSCYPATG